LVLISDDARIEEEEGEELGLEREKEEKEKRGVSQQVPVHQ
jgi:hypothetical protein